MSGSFGVASVSRGGRRRSCTGGGWDQLTREQLLVVVAEQATLIQTLTEQVQALTAQVAELTRLLGQNSGNSSLPPSTDRGRGPSRPRPGLESEARQAARRARLHAGDRH